MDVGDYALSKALSLSSLAILTFLGINSISLPEPLPGTPVKPFSISYIMPERQNFRCAPGDDCLPDLIITMPIDYDRMNSTLPDKRLVDSALEELLAQYESPRNKRDHRVIDHISHKRNTEASVSVNSKGHTGYHLRFGDQTPGQTRDSAAWPGHNNSACASCSKWSLACIHAAALNAFDEHDSDSDERQAVTVVQQLMCLQKGCADASRRSQQQAYHRVGSPMLQRWLSQSPRQEGFNGVATAQVLSRSATKSRL
jgi:hypothetical protein